MSNHSSAEKALAHWSGRIALLAAGAAAAVGGPAGAGATDLKERPVAQAGAVRLGDLFEGIDGVQNRAIAPAPRAGQVLRLETRFVQRAAAAAGVEWSVPAGLTHIEVRGPERDGLVASASPGASKPTIERGQLIDLVWAMPGVAISARGKALEGGRIGDSIRVQNISSQKTIEAVVDGPARALVRK